MNKEQEEHHIGDSFSLLTTLPKIDIIRIFLLDYMHLVCLGVTKKLILLWMKGPLTVRLRNRSVQKISSAVKALRSFVPCEFARKPRSLDEIGRWKATELRLFLLYTGFVVFLSDPSIVKKKISSHFLCLNIAMRILLSPEFISKPNRIRHARQLLFYFVKIFARLYGKHLVSHNVHGLLHLSDDFASFGPLDSCSCFPFENYMTYLKKYLRKGNQPLQQAVRRYLENKEHRKMEFLDAREKECLKMKHYKGPTIDGTFSPQYRVYLANGFKINSRSLADRFVLMQNGEIVCIVNFASSKNGVCAIGKQFNTKKDVYDKPCRSSKIGIFLVANLSHVLSCWNISDICKKYVVFPFENNHIAIPLMHFQ